MQFIYTMKGLGKVHPPDHVVLKDIWLSFLPGAKIGVLGLNGAGKSTLLRIMAGRGPATSSARRFRPTASRVGFLHAGAAARSDEDRARQRRGRRRRDPGAADALRRDQREVRRGAVARGDGQGPRRAGARSRTRSTPPTRWDLDSRLELAMDALRLPPADADVDDAVGRRAPPRRAVPAAAAVARPAAARRADQPPRRRIGRLARAVPQGLPGHGRRRHPRSLLPRQRRRLDSRARSRPRHPVGRQLLVVARAEAEAPRSSRRRPRRKRQRTLQRELEWIRMSPRARQAKGKARLNAYEELLRRGDGAEDRAGRDLHPARPAARRHRRRSARPAQGLRRQPADRRPRTSRCRAAASSASSGRTAPARRRCSG